MLCAKIVAGMPLLHDLEFLSQIERRLRALNSDSKPQWGKMSVDQMLWHVNQGLSLALGQITQPPQKAPLPRPILKWMVLNLPWPKGAPTMPALEAKEEHDFQHERTRCFELLKTFARKPLLDDWPINPIFGKVTGIFTSKLQAKHFDHHLKQFGA